jgi:hypothetical protein
MTTSPSRKRQRFASTSSEGSAEAAEDRASRQQKLRAEATPPQVAVEGDASPSSYPPPPGHELDRLNYHIDLQDFGRGLQDAANAVFTTDRRSRYTQVSALLLSWEDEDPQLPVSLEIRALKEVFVELYGFEVEEWLIPPVESHGELNMRVLNFLKGSNSKHLKIVYYAGHGKLSNHGQSLWTRLVVSRLLL